MTKATPPGTQVVYVPYRGAPAHLWEYGFITGRPRGEPNWEVMDCRYWRQGQPGCLRTKTNGEMTAIRCLFVKESFPQELVDSIWAELKNP